MGTSRLNVMVRDSVCVPIKTGWLLDLVVQLCNGTPLYEVFPIVDQLKDRYSKPARVFELTEFPLTDQSGNTLEVTVGSGTLQTYTFTTPATTQVEIYSQIKNVFSDCEVTLEDGHITITSKEKGPSATLVIGGSCGLAWAPVEQGSGYSISTRYYHGAQRIKIQPPSGEYINHVEMDVPPGCYKVWARVCFGDNEDTSKVMKVIDGCGECHTVDLLLPEIMNCSREIVYPLIDKVVNDYQAVFPDQADRLATMKVVAYTANLSREQILTELNDRRQDAVDIGRTDLADRVDQIIALAQALPQCC
jgi:hypothetical protein